MQHLFPFFALLGHVFLWIGLANRLHALGAPRRVIMITTLGCFLCAAIIPVGAGWHYLRTGTLGLLGSVYVVACWATLLATFVRLAYFSAFRRPPEIARFHGRRPAKIDLARAATCAADLSHHWLARLPRNEILQLEVTQWVLDVPRLPPALDGLSIAHFSDLHFTGRVGKAYFREVVRVSNELRPDLVCITGDLVERPSCLDWIADTFGRLAARHGVYFVLGNHDRRVDVGRLRRALEQSGLVDLGGRRRQISINATPIVLAGNERPWFSAGDGHSCLHPGRQECLAHRDHADQLRIMLAHTPDRLSWARAQDADLLLAGHTHGGQIRLPPLGAIFSPTATGVKYISGVFHAPPTILHVTRGLSGDTPVRWNCPPEIAHLRLRARLRTGC